MKVPVLVPERSRQSVLTTELVTGGSFEDACDAPVEARRAWAETLWRFVFKGNLAGGMFNADPHPSNYLFLPDGRVAFLDFGCVQELVPHRKGYARAMHHAAGQPAERGRLVLVRHDCLRRPVRRRGAGAGGGLAAPLNRPPGHDNAAPGVRTRRLIGS